MTPRGYLTIPEVLKIIRARIDDDDLLMQQNPKPDRAAVARESLARAIRDETVHVYRISGGAVVRIANDFADFDQTDTKSLIERWESWLPTGRVVNGSKYNGCRLFIRPASLEHWLGPAAEDVPIPKTGAPGRPSSMAVVMAEHRRRVSSGESACSRAVEGQALETWFKEMHLCVPCPTARTIQNNLPPDFQPRANHVSK
jgi:hypothetical protein